jgi:hypothetical protein
VFADPEGALRADPAIVPDQRHQQVHELGNAHDMWSPSRTHLNDFSFDQLDAFLLAENPRLRHLVELVDGEQASGDRVGRR